jgi:hypothetical protein
MDFSTQFPVEPVFQTASNKDLVEITAHLSFNIFFFD